MKTAWSFFEAREDAAKAFEPAEVPFDFIALLIDGAVILPRLDAVGLGRNRSTRPGTTDFKRNNSALVLYVV